MFLYNYNQFFFFLAFRKINSIERWTFSSSNKLIKNKKYIYSNIACNKDIIFKLSQLYFSPIVEIKYLNLLYFKKKLVTRTRHCAYVQWRWRWCSLVSGRKVYMVVGCHILKKVELFIIIIICGWIFLCIIGFVV